MTEDLTNQKVPEENAVGQKTNAPTNTSIK